MYIPPKINPISAIQTPLTKGSGPEEVQPYLAIHEVDDVSAFGGKEAEEANTTPWTKKHIEERYPFISTVWIVHYDRCKMHANHLKCFSHGNWSPLRDSNRRRAEAITYEKLVLLPRNHCERFRGKIGVAHILVISIKNTTRGNFELASQLCPM